MPDTSHSPEQIVRERLAAGDRVRRGREAMRLVWRAAPVLGAAGLALAVLAPWAPWPAAAAPIALAAGAAVLGGFAIVRRRSLPVSDAAAAAIDRDAAAGGEFRSANWFAGRAGRDDWADFHLAHAAARLQQIRWTDLYPRIRATRAQAAAAALAAATIALSVTLPERVAARPAPDAAADAPALRAPGAVAGRVLDPELQRQLEALLAAAATGTLPSVESLATDADMRAMLDRINQLSDAQLLDALKRALAENPLAGSAEALDNLKRFAEQARQAADSGTLPRELQDALEKLSDEIELASSKETVDADKANAGAGGSRGPAGDAGADGIPEELSIQFAKTAEAAGGAGVLMMSSPEASSGGAGGSGVGGAGSDEMNASAAAALDAALERETVEASQDNPGENVDTDIRRKTEQGSATVRFTGSASAQFDRARAVAAPPVPEARRPGVQTYFVRKPQ